MLWLPLLRWIVIYKVYHSIPLHELKRRARSGDRRANKLYKVAAYGPTLDLLLWKIGTAVAAVLVIWSARTNWWLAAAAIILISWLLVWPKFSAEGWAGSLAAFFSPFDSRVLSIFQPVLGRPAAWLSRGRRASVHTSLYEKKDLLEILNKQNKQVDSRISPQDLKIATNALEFGDKTVGSIMTPRKEVKMVKADDNIGPLLMDELHKSGFARFPVVKEVSKNAAPEIVGTLYINNLIGYEGGGKVKDLARKEVYYINEDSNLHQALSAFLKTHHHLLIVVNSFEEMAGVVTLEDVLEQILGKQVTDEFENYEDLRSVAKAEVQEEHKNHNESGVAPDQK